MLFILFLNFYWTKEKFYQNTQFSRTYFAFSCASFFFKMFFYAASTQIQNVCYVTSLISYNVTHSMNNN